MKFTSEQSINRSIDHQFIFIFSLPFFSLFVFRFFPSVFVCVSLCLYESVCVCVCMSVRERNKKEGKNFSLSFSCREQHQIFHSSSYYEFILNFSDECIIVISSIPEQSDRAADVRCRHHYPQQ